MVKISLGIDRNKGKEIRGRDGKWEGRRHVFGEMLVAFEEDTGAAQSQQTSKALH